MFFYFILCYIVNRHELIESLDKVIFIIFFKFIVRQVIKFQKNFDHLDKVISLKLTYYFAIIIYIYCFILAVKV